MYNADKKTGKNVTETQNVDIVLLSTKAAAKYLGLEYAYFRKWRNVGYFGRDRYPAPSFICFGENETMIRYHRAELDRWLAEFPRYQTPASYFFATQQATTSGESKSGSGDTGDTRIKEEKKRTPPTPK